MSHAGVSIDTEVLERNPDGNERYGRRDVDGPDAGASCLLERESEESAGDDHAPGRTRSQR